MKNDLKKRVLYALNSNGSMTSKELSDICGQTGAACLRAARKLCEAGLVKESSKTAKNGRTLPVFSAVRTKKCALGVHIMPQSVMVSVVNQNGKTAFCRRFERDSDYTNGNGVNELCDLIEMKIMSEKHEICAIGVTCAGPVLQSGGMLRRVESYGGFDIEKLVNELKAAFALPVTFGSTAQALGEYCLATKRGYNTGVTVCVDASDSIFASIFDGGKPLSGAAGLAGIMGHTSLNFRDERCYCGNRGCLEQYASTSLLVDRLQTNTLFGMNMRSFDETVELYRSGDPATVKEVDNAASYLAMGLVNAIWLLNPSHICIAGELAKFDGALNKTVHSVIKQRVLPEAFSSLTVDICDCDADVFAAGAALSAFGETI